MKNLIYLLTLSLFAFTACEQEEIIDITEDKAPVKITICHYDAEMDTWRTMEIPEKALKGHLKHGDFLGDCSRRTYLDGGIEHFLIECGYDDVFDGSVLTSNISTITQMTLPFDGGGGSIDGSSCFSPWEIVTLTGIEDFIALENFSFGGTILTSVDLSTLVNLERLTINEPYYVTSLNLTNNLALKFLNISGGKYITNLDLTKNVNLEVLYIQSFFTWLTITSLDLTENIALYKIDITGTFITTLDLSNNGALTYFNFDADPLLTSLNLKNGNNINITYLNVGSPVLTCFQVDDAAWSTANWTTDYTYTEDCY